MANAPRALTNITIQFNDDDSPSERTTALNRLSQAISAIANAINGNASQNTPSTIDFADPTGMVELEPVDGVLTTAMRSDAAPPLDQSIEPVMTGQWIFDTDNLGNSLYPQIVLRNSYNATAAVPQWSPLLQWIAEGWSGLKSQSVTFVAGVRPTGPTGAVWVLSSEIGGSGFSDIFSIDNGGNITEATWQGTVVAQEYGGTGHTPPYAPGDILIGDAGGSGQLDVEPIQAAIAGTQIQWNQIVGAYVGMAEDGEDGAAGPPGARGPIGPQGPSGSGGSGGGGMIFMGGDDGEQGMGGPPGPRGNTGATGATGPAGAAGAKGTPGPPGDGGNDGEDGMMIAPNPALIGAYPAALGYGAI